MRHKLSKFLGGVWTWFTSHPGPRAVKPMPPEPWNPPKRAHLISISWHSPHHPVVPDIVPPRDAKHFAGFVAFVVGIEGAGDGHGCWTNLWTIGYLEEQCRAARLAWPRGLALIEAFTPIRTLSDLTDAIRQLCHRHSARTYEALLGPFEQYGWFEYEVKGLFIENQDRFSPLEGKLLTINFTDFADSVPEDQTHFGDTVRIKVGVAPNANQREHYDYFRDRHGLTIGNDEVEFEFLLCTPSWFESHHDLSQPIICKHVAFTDRFDRASIEETVALHCRDCVGFDMADVVEDMVPYARQIDR